MLTEALARLRSRLERVSWEDFAGLDTIGTPWYMTPRPPDDVRRLQQTDRSPQDGAAHARNGDSQ